MRKITVALALLLSTSAGAEPASCDTVDSKSMRVTGPELSVSEVETIGRRYAANNPRAPQVPFAYDNDKWSQLKAQYRSGDKLHAVELLWPPTGKPYAWGYALVRGNCVIGFIGTRVA